MLFRSLPDESQPYRVQADGSGIATGAVLEQLSREDNKWHPIAFLSKSLSPVERNYEIHDTEMLAIIRALEEWRHYLEGARHPVEIWTDHKEPRVLLHHAKAESQAGPMVTLSVEIQFLLPPQTREVDGQTRCPFAPLMI